MAGQSGSNYIVYIAQAENSEFPATSDYPTGYEAAGFSTSDSITINNPLLEDTNKASGSFRSVTTSNGVRTLDITVDGTAEASTLQQLVRSRVIDRSSGPLFITVINAANPTEDVLRAAVYPASNAQTNPNGATATINVPFNSTGDFGYFAP